MQNIKELANRFSNQKMPIVTLLEIISELQSKVDEIKVPNEKEIIDEVMSNLHRLSKLKSFEANIDLEPTKEELKGYTEEEIQKLKEYVSAFSDELSTGNEEKLSSIGQELNDLLKSHTAKIYGDYGNLSKKINDKISQIKNGVDGINGTNGKDGKDGTDAEITPEKARDLLEKLKDDERLDKSAIKGLKEWMDTVDSKSTTVITQNNSGTRGLQYYDLSDSLNGVLKTFSLPAFGKIIDVKLSSLPTLRPIVDYTVDGSLFTITFTSQVQASTDLSSGQSFIVIYAEN